MNDIIVDIVQDTPHISSKGNTKYTNGWVDLVSSEIATTLIYSVPEEAKIHM